MPLVTRQYNVNQQVWFVDAETMTAFSGIVTRVLIHIYSTLDANLVESVKYEVFSPDTSEYFIATENFVRGSAEDVAILLAELTDTNFCDNNISPTITPTVTPTPSASVTPAPSASLAITPTPTASAVEPTPTPTPTVTLTITPTVTPTTTIEPTPTPTPSASAGGDTPLLSEGGSPILTEDNNPIII